MRLTKIFYYWHQRAGINAFSIRSPYVDDEKIRSCHWVWLGWMICVPFSAFSNTDGWMMARVFNP